MDKNKMLSKMLKILKESDPERLARLESMGTDTSKVMFHGTGENRNPFFQSPENIKPFEEFQKKTTFVTPDPEFAAAFAHGTNQRTIPVFAPKGKYLDSLDLEQINDLAHEVEQMALNGKMEWDRANDYLDAINQLENSSKKILSASPEKAKYMSNWNLLESIQPILKKLGYSGYKELEGGVENLAVFDPSGIKSIWAKGKGPGLIGGTAAAAMLGGQEAKASIDPLPLLGELAEKYRSIQEPIADVITERVSQPFGGADEGLKTLGRIGFDPLNIGVAGDIAGAVELLTPEAKKEKLKAEMRRP